jgi:DnaK suppressor protein
MLRPQTYPAPIPRDTTLRSEWCSNGGMTDPAERLATRRTETLDLITALDRRLNGIMESSAYTSNDDEHDPEGVTIAFERAQVAGLLDQARAELVSLDAAGERLAAGAYGTCTRCGHPIAAERLDALPATTVCIDCANRR